MVSLNTIMVDGTGMCGSCRVTVGGEVRSPASTAPTSTATRSTSANCWRARSASRARRPRPTPTTPMSATWRSCCFVRASAPTRSTEVERAPGGHARARRAERARNFDEVNLGYGLADALREAERCIQCSKPTCIEGCPVRIDIPRFIRHLLVRDLDGALEVIHESSPSPRCAGGSARKKASARRSASDQGKMEPVAIGRLERFVGDHAPRRAAPCRRSSRSWAAWPSWAPARGAGGGGRPGARRRRGHRVRGAARGGRRAALRHPVVPPAARHHRARGAAAARPGRAFETNKVIGKTFTVAQLTG
jgi:glutamate synthase (NADPH/NADH) small chain